MTQLFLVKIEALSLTKFYIKEKGEQKLFVIESFKYRDIKLDKKKQPRSCSNTVIITDW